MPRKNASAAIFLVVLFLIIDVPTVEAQAYANLSGRIPKSMAAPSVEAALTMAAAEDLVVGFPNPNEVREINDDLDVDGNVIIVNSGRLRINDARLRVRGNIHVFQSGGFEVQGGSLEFQQDHLYQRTITLTNKSSLWLNNAIVLCGGFNIGCAVTDTSILRIDGSSFSGGLMTTTLASRASVEATGSQRIGELLFFDFARGSFTNCDQLLTWLTLPASSTLDATLPGAQVLDSYHFPDSAISTGFDYAISWTGCTTLFWGLMLEPTCSAVLRDSDLLAVGSLFRGNGSALVTGLVNNAIPQDFQYPAADRDVRFLGCDVRTWNLYTLDNFSLAVRNCIFGEVLAMGSSDVVVQTSICDGTGGYVGCQDDATLLFAESQITAPVLARGRGQLTLLQSALQTHVPHAADNGVIALFHSTFPALPTVEAGSVAVAMGIDEPKQAEVDADVRVHGTMRFLAGDEVPVHFLSYWFDAVREDNPEEIVFSSRPSIIQRYRDTLGIWDTRGHAPGTHYLRLHMRLSSEDTIIIPSLVLLKKATVGITATPTTARFEIEDVYPNPLRAGNLLHIRVGNLPATGGELRMMDLLGRTIMSRAVASRGEVELVSDAISPGIYTLMITVGNTVQTQIIHIIR